jgi:tetratricopeptide (TPR) repeat protein
MTTCPECSAACTPTDLCCHTCGVALENRAPAATLGGLDADTSVRGADFTRDGSTRLGLETATRFEAVTLPPVRRASAALSGDAVTGVGYVPGALPPPQAPQLKRPSVPELAVTMAGHASPGEAAAASAEDHDAAATGAPGTEIVASSGGPLEPDQLFGSRYRIKRLLGIGGMGAVYQAWDSELGVFVALKLVRPEIAADPAAARDLQQRFKRELLLARQVTHKNVVRIHDLGEIDGIKYITMPFVDGEDLSTVLRREGRLSVPRALRIMRSMLSGLVAAHQAGVVHRDLKPANIMVSAEDEALIMDFGIARLAEPSDADGAARGGAPAAPGSQIGLSAIGSTRVGSIVGTLEYMPPEQAKGLPVDQRADIYAFGMMCAEILAGRRAFANTTDTLADLALRMKVAPPSPRAANPAVPEALDRLIAKCLEPEADARWLTSAELAEALDRLDGDGKPRKVARHLTRRLVLASAGVVVALLTGTWYVSRTPPPPKAHAPVSVLVADFENRTGEPVFNGLMEQTVTVGIEGASFISAYQRPAALRVAKMLRAGSGLDEQAARLVALREGVKVVLLGTIDRRGDGYAFTMRGVDPTSGNVLLTSEARARDRDAVLGAGATLASRVRASLGDTRPDASDQKEAFSTASLEAVSAYTRAQELSSAGKDQDAIGFFEKATALDPDFGRAYGGLAMSLTRLGRKEEAGKLWQEALKHLDRMTEREQFRLLGAYYTLVTRNFETARDTYEKLVKQYPADGAGHNNLAVAYFRGLQFAKALDEGRRVRQVYPSSPLYRTNQALYAMYAGDFGAAREEAQALVDEGQASYDAYLPLAVGAIADGKIDLARDAYDRMSKTDPEGASLSSVGLADLALYQGRAGEAAILLRTGISHDEAAQNPAGAGAKQIALADALGMQGDLKGAVAAARKALVIDKTEAQIVPAARWLVAAGNLDEAAGLGAELDKRLETQSRAYGRIVAAEIALARGRKVEAVDALREALKLADLWLVHYHLGLAYLEAAAPAEALSEFELCLKRRGEGFAVFLDDIPTVRYVAPVRYWMGRAREGLGLLPQAQAEYRAFVGQQSSESSDPLLTDARTRVGRQ